MRSLKKKKKVKRGGKSKKGGAEQTAREAGLKFSRDLHIKKYIYLSRNKCSGYLKSYAYLLTH